MALHLGARAPDTQIFGAEVEGLAVIEGDGQRLAVLVQPQLRRPGCRRCVAHFELLARGADRCESRSRRRRAIARAEVEADMLRPTWGAPKRRNICAAMSLPQSKVPHAGKSERGAKRLSPHLIFCLHDNKINRNRTAMRDLRPIVANGRAEGRQSDANSTWRDARFHSDVLIWPCKAECRVERACAQRMRGRRARA